MSRTATVINTSNTIRVSSRSENQGEVKTILKYLTPNYDPTVRPWYKRPPPPTGEGGGKGNYETDPFDVNIHDARGHESDFSLDVHGFSFGCFDKVDETLLDKIRDDIEGNFIKDIYYKEMGELLKAKMGASKVVVFDHLVRKRPEEEMVKDLGKETVVNGPVQTVHVDQSKEYAHGFLGRMLKRHGVGDSVIRRAQIINVWRPLINEVEDYPLAVLDNRTLSPSSLVPSKAIYENESNNREIYAVLHDPAHKWHFLSKQNKDEAIFIKCFDTKEDVASCAPHTSFVNPKASPGAPPRESIEVRAWVFYAGDDESEQVEIKTTPEWANLDLMWTSRWSGHAQY